MNVIPFAQQDPGRELTDSFTQANVRVALFPDRDVSGKWRVEYQDDDGACYIVTFTGPAADRRARAYFQALRSGALALVIERS
jgi:hypothetical protein